jgi:molybdopterin molybdotransferase
MKKLISFGQAWRIVCAQSVQLKTRKIPLTESRGFVVAKSVRASVDNPPFRQSAMDGYAIKWKPGSVVYTLPETGLDVPAGKWHSRPLKQGQAIRIFTGAMLPQPTDTVVAQELVEIDGNGIRILDKDFRKGRNVRPQGSHFKKGKLLLSQGCRINSGAIALLAQSGITHISVAKRPKVAVLVTGDELVSSGKQLKGAGIYESNSSTLLALLDTRGIKEVRLSLVPDDPIRIQKALRTLLRWADILLVTGGVSVGDYDHVPSCMQAIGVDLLFHKVRQKPGKPILFGRKGQRYVFGLPGNPGSVISCFHTLVAPLLSKWEGEKIQLPMQGLLKQKINFKPGLTHFLKARLENGVVEILDGQESYKVDAYVKANVLAMIPDTCHSLNTGDPVACIPIHQ